MKLGKINYLLIIRTVQQTPAHTQNINTEKPKEPGSTSNRSPRCLLTNAAIVHAMPIPMCVRL